MNKDFRKLFEKAKQIKLYAEEKEEMRAKLELFVEKHPVRKAGVLRHLFSERSEFNVSVFSEMLTLKALIKKLQFMSIAIIIAIILGGGASFAAESSLPGDTLYPVKIGINEEVRSFAAFSSESQARWDARRAERRLEEAEKLAVSGNLDSETRVKIESRFENHARDFEKFAEKAEVKNGARVGIELHSEFEGTLNAHESLLTNIASAESGAKGEVESILVKVRAGLQTSAQSRGEAEAKVSSETGAEFKAAAEGKLKAAENKIEEVRNFIEKIDSSVSGETETSADIKIGEAEEILARGKAELEAGEYGKAFVSFGDVIRAAQEAKVTSRIEKDIGLEIVPLKAGVGADGKAGTGVGIEVGEDSGMTPGAGVEAGTETKASAEVEDTQIKSEGGVKVDLGL
ncbi:MAG: DUF5667 domain-containing protein [bacterium]|nr:DUF5667 domain-containing protein [bacterium]